MTKMLKNSILLQSVSTLLSPIVASEDSEQPSLLLSDKFSPTWASESTEISQIREPTEPTEIPLKSSDHQSSVR